MSLGPSPPDFPRRPHRRPRPSRSPFLPREQLLTAADGGAVIVVGGYWAPGSSFVVITCLLAVPSSPCLLPLAPSFLSLLVPVVPLSSGSSLSFRCCSFPLVPRWPRRSHPVAPHFHPVSSCSQQWNGVLWWQRRRSSSGPWTWLT
jgi:hypothetical protein